ncbi:hypothetical protein D3C76_1585850 [compost metagenome]
MVTQQQQHAQGGTVEVGGLFQVDHHRLERLVFVGCSEILMLGEIESSLDRYRQFFPVRGDFCND